jgi:hypothetical protein
LPVIKASLPICKIINQYFMARYSTMPLIYLSPSPIMIFHSLQIWVSSNILSFLLSYLFISTESYTLLSKALQPRYFNPITLNSHTTSYTFSTF